MMVLGSLLFLLAVAAVVLYLMQGKATRGKMGSKRSAAKGVQSGSAVRLPDNAFHAVSIHPGKNCCSAVKLIQTERYLTNKVPRLPLSTCDASHCDCRYTHHEDRRSGEDRRTVFGSMGRDNAWTQGKEGKNRRTGGDRRRQRYGKSRSGLDVRFD